MFGCLSMICWLRAPLKLIPSAVFVVCINNFQYQFEAYVRYMTLQQNLECGSKALVFIGAPKVTPSVIQIPSPDPASPSSDFGSQVPLE